LAQKQALQERVTQEEEHARGILEQRDALAKTLEQVPGQIASAKKKRDELSKRLMKAKMSGRRADLDGVTRDAKDFVNDEGAFDTFDRMAEKIEGAEAESEALVELAGLDSNLKREQSEKELRKLDVEAALAELKARAEKSPALNEDKDLEEFKKMLKDT
jgi:phage shock protein A